MNISIIFGFLALIVSVLLTFIVLIQNSKGGGLSSAFGASNLTNMIGNRRATQDVEKFTWYLAAALAAISFMATITLKSNVQQQDDGFGKISNSAPTAAPGVQAQPPGGGGIGGQ